jgi:bacillaene synthase trans-acting acyltransferase
MFAGQGSQYYRMGREFYERKAVFRDWMNFCSRRLEPVLGLSLTDLLYGPRSNPFAAFDETRLTHPAIFCINYSVTQTLIADGIRPSLLLGYSLGELVAWCVAGILRLEDALPLVCEMAAKIELETPPAAMLAILGPPELAEAHPEVFGAVAIACINYTQNFVVVGTPEVISQIQRALRPLDVPCQLLPISRGFHSPLLDPVEATLKAALSGVPLRLPEIPIVSSMFAAELTSSDVSPEHCWDVVRRPVRFLETIRYLESQAPGHYIDVGPSGTLASFVRMIVGRDAESRAYPVLTPFGHDASNLEKLHAVMERHSGMGYSTG